MVYIPEKFFVARQKRSKDEVLAFMVVADKEHTKAYIKDRDRAESWATPYHKSYEKLESIFIDNNPKTGFKLVTNVSRYSTSNVVWRIMHPEGFEFEITSDNLCDLLDTNTIIEGEFQEELFFTHTKKLVSIKTKLFSEMIKKEEDKKNNKQKSNELQPGTTIKISIKNRYFPEDETKNTTYDNLLYYGKFHTCNNNKNKPMLITNKSTSRPVVFDLSIGKFRTFTELPPFEIIDNEIKTIDRENTILLLNEQIRLENFAIPLYYQDSYIPNEILPVFFNEKPYNYSDLKLKFESVSSSEVLNICYNKVYKSTNHRIFGFYFENKTTKYHNYHYESEKRSDYERDDTDLKTAGFLGELITHIEDNGLPVISTDIYSHKDIIGYYGPFKNQSNKLVRLGFPETIDIGIYVLGK